MNTNMELSTITILRHVVAFSHMMEDGNLVKLFVGLPDTFCKIYTIIYKTTQMFLLKGTTHRIPFCRCLGAILLPLPYYFTRKNVPVKRK